MNATTKLTTQTSTAIIKPIVKHDGLYCPECGAGPYQKATGLGSHRKAMHKIMGTSEAALEYRRKRIEEGKKVRGITMPINKNDQAPKTPCPECKKMIDTSRLNGHRREQHGVDIQDDFEKCPHCDRSFSHAGLGIHLKAAHGVPGKTSPEGKTQRMERLTDISVPVNALIAVPAELPTEVPTEIIVHKGRPTNASKGLPLVKRTSNNVLVKEMKNAQTATRQGDDPTPEQEGAIAYTVGRLEAICLQQAERFDLPPQQFTRWCIEHLQRATIR